MRKSSLVQTKVRAASVLEESQSQSKDLIVVVGVDVFGP